MTTRRQLAYLSSHQAHDYRALIKRWNALARRSRQFAWEPFWSQEEYPVHVLRSLPGQAAGFYVSAGIHGDEPAAPWGLLEWAESNAAWLRSHPTILFPCLNPWGLIENRRTDRLHRDLNRCFHRSRLPFMRAWGQAMRGQHVPVALCLHEDYDARGIYVYDLNRENDFTSVRRILSECASPAMPVDRRSRIDGLRAQTGVITRRRVDLSTLTGTPEAVHLYLAGFARRTLTFETPSEFALYDRVQAHREFVSAAATLAQSLAGGL